MNYGTCSKSNNETIWINETTFPKVSCKGLTNNDTRGMPMQIFGPFFVSSTRYRLQFP